MTRKRRRLWLLLTCLVGFGTAVGLGLSAISSNLVYFLLPTQVLAQHPRSGEVFRLGGIVADHSLKQATIGGKPGVRFLVTDGKASVPVKFVGVLPGLFREGQGVVAVGSMLPNGVFDAREILAKHSASYMPKAVETALKKNGLWNPNAGPAPPPQVWDSLRVAKAGS